MSKLDPINDHIGSNKCPYWIQLMYILDSINVHIGSNQCTYWIQSMSILLTRCQPFLNATTHNILNTLLCPCVYRFVVNSSLTVNSYRLMTRMSFSYCKDWQEVKTKSAILSQYCCFNAHVFI